MKFVPSVWTRQGFSTRSSIRVPESSPLISTRTSDTCQRKKIAKIGEQHLSEARISNWKQNPCPTIQSIVTQNADNVWRVRVTQHKEQDRSPSTFDTRYNRDIRSYVRHGDWLPSDAKRLGPGGPSGSQGGSRMRLAAGKATEEGGNAILAGSRCCTIVVLHRHRLETKGEERIAGYAVQQRSKSAVRGRSQRADTGEKR